MDGPKRVGQRNGGHRLTRRRVPLSCTACRVRKLKCNREKPCQNCVVRGEANAASCTYAEKAEKKPHGQSNPRSDAEDMRKRLNRLESSILSMMSKDEAKKPTQLGSPESHVTNEDSTSETSEKRGGQSVALDTRSTHWDTILNELGEMKSAWSEENDKIEYSSGVPHQPFKSYRASLLSGLSQPPDRPTIMSSLPSRTSADKLIVRFFESYNPLIPARFVIHRPSFLKQYQRHWENPEETPIIWTGMLFGMLCIAMQSYARNNDVPPEYQGTAPAIMDLYRVRMAQCLVITDLTKPCEFMIETMILHSFCEYFDERDGDIGTWLLSETTIRLAMHQGYHRDPSHNLNITPFEGELRRRLWAAVNQMEVLFSVMVGVPKSFIYAHCDTKPPSNLYDDELFEEMKGLPPSRPLEEATDISFQVVKAQVMHAYGLVVEFLYRVQPQTYEEVLKLDLMLMETRNIIPSHLQLRTLSEMARDPPSKIMERYILQEFWHKSVCVLHRKYWNSKPSDHQANEGPFFYSRKTCVASSMELLGYQESMHQASRPGRCLFTMKWYNFTSTKHDFLLAAMIICLDLMSTNNFGCDTQGQVCSVTPAEKLNAIHKSRAIWAEIVDESLDAKRAVSILDAVLKKLSAKMQDQTQKDDFTAMDAPVSASATNPTVDTLRYSPYFTDQFALGVPLIAEPAIEEDIFMQNSVLDSLGSDFMVPSDFNWDAWDQLMFTQPQYINEMPDDLQGF